MALIGDTIAQIPSRPRHVAWQFGSHGGAAIRELVRHFDEAMHALEFFVNGSRVCVASPGEEGLVISNVVLTGTVPGPPGTSTVRFRIGGIRKEQHLEWISRSLKLGDVVEIRIVDAPQSDPPASIEPITDDQRERLRAASDGTDIR